MTVPYTDTYRLIAAIALNPEELEDSVLNDDNKRKLVADYLRGNKLEDKKDKDKDKPNQTDLEIIKEAPQNDQFGFQVIAIKLEKGCSEQYLKNLNVDKPYYFYSGYNIEENNIYYEKHIDECKVPTTKSNIINLNENMQKQRFNPLILLQELYSINKYQHLLLWFDEYSYENYYTKMRILNCFWLAFFKDIDILNEEFINIHINLFKEVELNKLVDKIQDHIHLVDNNIKISKDGIRPEQSEIKKYVDYKFITINTFTKFLIKFLDVYSKTWETVEIPLDLIFSKFIKYIVDKVNKTI